MTRDALKTLFHPFTSGEVALPAADAEVLFIGAGPGFVLPEGFPKQLYAVQGFRPDYLRLQATVLEVTPELPSGLFDLSLVLCDRHRGENELRVAEAITRTKPGGLIIAAGAKDDGIASLRRRLENEEDELLEAIGRRKTPSPIVVDQAGTVISPPRRLHSPSTAPVPLAGHIAKYHGIAFWLERTSQAEAFAAAIGKWHSEWPRVGGRFRTAPGMFSFDRVDAGSRLLAGHLPVDLTGRVADFCAGWGYLSAAVAECCPDVKSIDLYEADFASLEAAKDNLAGLPVPARFFWHDLLSEPVAERYDSIVMNPPFHKGRAGEPSIGQGMIRAAASALRKGGRLFLVANRQLPYEEALSAAFSSVERLADEGGFKVIVARR